MEEYNGALLDERELLIEYEFEQGVDKEYLEDTEEDQGQNEDFLRNE